LQRESGNGYVSHLDESSSAKKSDRRPSLFSKLVERRNSTKLTDTSTTTTKLQSTTSLKSTDHDQESVPSVATRKFSFKRALTNRRLSQTRQSDLRKSFDTEPVLQPSDTAVDADVLSAVEIVVSDQSALSNVLDMYAEYGTWYCCVQLCFHREYSLCRG
jgi:hypothetical protein